MFRLFIVDDNKYERYGIKESIDWRSLGIEVVGVFANGMEALARMDELKPHIVITDIAMPIMNGVEMSERIRRSYPDVKIIFISCHSDFEFAKSAVDLGVYGYVLKPIIADELEEALKKLLREFTDRQLELVEKERMMKQLEDMLPLVQEQFWREVLLGNFRNGDDIRKRIDFLSLPAIDSAVMSVLSIKYSPGGGGEREERSAMDAYYVSYAVKSVIAAAAGPLRAVYPVQIAEDDFSAIVVDRDGGSQGAVEAAAAIHTEIGRRLGLHATLGISNGSSRLADLSTLYKQSRKALNTGFYGGSNPIIRFAEVEDRSDIPFEKLPGMEEVYQDMKTLITEGGERDVETFIDNYLNAGRLGEDESYVKGFTALFVHMTGFLLMETSHSAKDIFGDDIWIWEKLSRMPTKADATDWIRGTLLTLTERLSERNGAKNVKLVDAIRHIIHTRYAEQLSIEDISKSVYLSGRHANALFKKETGKTIFDYLIHYRIDKAKQLLKEENAKVAAVAEAVGYLNTSYFILSFKKNTGMTPAEYKSKVAQL